MKNLIIMIVIATEFAIKCSYGQIFTPLPPGFDNTVRCLFYDTTNNLLYAGGNFYFEGFPSQLSSPVNKIAVWNGNSWDSLGSGVTQPGYLLDLTMYNGNLIAAGSYNEIGGVSSRGIGLWDGVSWQYFADIYDSSASGLYGSVAALKVIGNDLYVGGGFNRVNGMVANSLAKFDGFIWSTFPSLGQDAVVGSIIYYDSELYVAGNFITSFGSIVDIAKFNGTNWVNIGGGIPGPLDHVTSLEEYQGKLIVGGQFNTNSGAPGNNIVAWDGNSWSTLGTGLNLAVTSMEVIGMDLYVSGIFTTANGQSANRIAKWDGNNWFSIGQNETINSGVLDIEYGNQNLYAGGGFTKISGDSISFIAQMNLTTSLNENSSNNFLLKMYPNPCSGNFTLLFNQDITVKKIELFDIYGYKVYNFLTVVGSSNIELKFEDTIKNGLYFLRVSSDSFSLNNKIYIQR